jgi:hypothetical protein
MMTSLMTTTMTTASPFSFTNTINKNVQNPESTSPAEKSARPHEAADPCASNMDAIVGIISVMAIVAVAAVTVVLVLYRMGKVRPSCWDRSPKQLQAPAHGDAEEQAEANEHTGVNMLATGNEDTVHAPTNTEYEALDAEVNEDT